MFRTRCLLSVSSNNLPKMSDLIYDYRTACTLWAKGINSCYCLWMNTIIKLLTCWFLIDNMVFILCFQIKPCFVAAHILCQQKVLWTDKDAERRSTKHCRKRDTACGHRKGRHRWIVSSTVRKPRDLRVPTSSETGADLPHPSLAEACNSMTS